MLMVVIAFVLSIIFMAVGVSGFGVGIFLDGMARYILAFLPGLVGLALAVVALVIFLIPETSGWAWLPCVLSYCTTLGMVTYVGVINLLSRLFS